ncbi:hypothetical protein ABIA35_008069 [Catenulispora sp. MAP12-49]|uniref:hypothetical protein n=1 Tax=Catenulispora sp. MAP12-49 TaxID=3156302 RepID=UPI0035187FC1
MTYAETPEHLGQGQVRARTPLAVEHTAPFVLYCYPITIIWYTLHGHHPDDAAERRRTPALVRL